jgi:hypothetical protein
MDIDQQINLEHLLFVDRKCRTCGQIKSLIDDFYFIRKGRGFIPSSYSYECKQCTKKRILNARKAEQKVREWEYPDW